VVLPRQTVFTMLRTRKTETIHAGITYYNIAIILYDVVFVLQMNNIRVDLRFAFFEGYITTEFTHY